MQQKLEIQKARWSTHTSVERRNQTSRIAACDWLMTIKLQGFVNDSELGGSHYARNTNLPGILSGDNWMCFLHLNHINSLALDCVLKKKDVSFFCMTHPAQKLFFTNHTRSIALKPCSKRSPCAKLVRVLLKRYQIKSGSSKWCCFPVRL